MFKQINSNRHFSGLAILFVILTTVSLYFSFSKSEIVFDDHGLFTNLRVYEFAQEPVDFKARTFPYFTLGLIQVLTQSLAANRIFNVLLHLACACLMFLLLRALILSLIHI